MGTAIRFTRLLAVNYGRRGSKRNNAGEASPTRMERNTRTRYRQRPYIRALTNTK